MIAEKTVRLSLAATAIFNLGAAMLLLLDNSALSLALGITPATSVIHKTLAVMMVAALGFAYGWLFMRPQIDAALLGFGACVKATAFSTFFVLAAMGEVAVNFALFAIPDIGFAVLWFLWLKQSKDNRHA